MKLKSLTYPVSAIGGLLWRRKSPEKYTFEGQPHKDFKLYADLWQAQVKILQNDKTYQDLLFNQGASSDLLTPQHAKAYEDMEEKLIEQGFQNEIGTVKGQTAHLINMGVSPERLKLFYDLILFDHLSNKNILKSFKKLIAVKPDASAWKRYEDVMSFALSKNHGIHRGISEVTSDFFNLTVLKPSESEWEMFDKIISHYKNNNYHIDDALKSFTKLLKMTRNETKLSHYNNLLKLYKNKDSDLAIFTSCFADVAKKATNTLHLQVYEQALKYCRHQGWEIIGLTNSFVSFLKKKPTIAELVFLKDTIIKNFDKSFNLGYLVKGFVHVAGTKPNKEQLQFISDTYFYYFFGQHEDYEKFATNFARLVEANPDKEKWEYFKELAGYHRTNNKNLTTLTFWYAAMVKLNLSDEKWKDFKDFVEQYKAKNLELDDLVVAFGNFNSFTPSDTLYKTFKSAIGFHLNLSDNSGDRREVLNCFETLAQMNEVPALIRNYQYAIDSGYLKTAEDSKKLITEITIHSAICNLIRADNEVTREYSRNIIQNTAQNDPVPYPIYDVLGNPNPEAIKVYDETFSVYRRAYNVHHGFSSLTFATKRPPTKESPLLARFGKDVTGPVGDSENKEQYVHCLNAKDVNLFPGRGYKISGLNPYKIFVADDDALFEDGDPFNKYKQAWSWAAGVFDDLPNTEFIFTRGFIAVTNKSDKYKLLDVNGKKVHFSYVIFNDHHHNYACNVAFLVPTDALMKKIKETEIPHDSYTGPIKTKKDINEIGLKPEDMISDAAKRKENFINLCWGSNIGGGLCNGYLPGSSPFHEWETKKNMKGQTRDFYGHVHKSHITGSWQRNSTKEQDEKLKPLRAAHSQVYEITNNYQNLLDLFKISFSLWCKGQTIGELPERPDDYNFNEDDYEQTKLSEMDGYGNTEQILKTGDVSNFSSNPNSNRMLIESYKWHSARESGNNNKNDFPVLVLTNGFDWWSKPNTPFYLDTYDMTLTIDDEKIQLPLNGNGTGNEELDIWYNKIILYTENSRNDLRFYDRRDLELS